MSSDLKRGSTLLHEARAAGYEIPAGDVFRRFRESAASAQIPAQLVGGKWCFDQRDLHKIAQKLGLQRSNSKVAA